MYNENFDPSVMPAGTVSAHNNLDALTYQGASAEFYAVCVQTYRLAKLVLEARLAGRPYASPAVIMDLDETVFDNGWYQAYLVRTGRNFHDDSWDAWCFQGLATAIPGAVDFIEYARSKGVGVFFITSRAEKTRQGTLDNLLRIGAIGQSSHSDESSLLKSAKGAIDIARSTCLFMKDLGKARGGVDLRDPSSGQPLKLDNKFEHRTYVEQFRRREVVLSLGDNLSDFGEYYGRRRVYPPVTPCPNDPPPFTPRWNEGGKYATWDERRQMAVQDRACWGTDFIVIPNPAYGGFLRAFTDHYLGSTAESVYTPDPVRGALAEDLSKVTYYDYKEKKKVDRTAVGPRIPYLYHWEPGATPADGKTVPGAVTLDRNGPA